MLSRRDKDMTSLHTCMNKDSQAIWTRLTILLIITLVLFHDSIGYMISLWPRGDNSYCFLIPLVIAYLIWEKRTELKETPTVPSWSGLFVLLLGIMLFWFGELGGEYFTLHIASWFTIIGILVLMLGWKKVRVMGFALAMLLTMSPLPSFLQSRLSVKLKIISSTLGVEMMRWLGMSAYQTGNIIDLGFTQLQVVEACSGLRYFFPLIILGLLIAYFSRAALWKKALLVLSTIPLVVISNSLRIAGTGLLYEHFGPVVAKGFFHDLAGLFMFIVAVMVLIPEMWILTRIFPKKSGDRQPDTSGPTAGSGTNPVSCPGAGKGWLASMVQPQFVVAAGLLILTLGLSHLVDFREKIPANKPLSTFPLRIGNWQGTRHTMGQHLIDALDFSDYALIDYKNPDGKLIDFYVAYYESQRKGESIHSPTTCLTGGGWTFKTRGERTILLGKDDGKGSLKVTRALIEQTGLRQIAYYWFPMRGRDLTNAYQMKIYNFWDALTRHRTDGALVRIITPLAPDESPADGDRRLEGFLKQLIPILNQYLPGKDLDTARKRDAARYNHSHPLAGSGLFKGFSAVQVARYLAFAPNDATGTLKKAVTSQGL